MATYKKDTSGDIREFQGGVKVTGGPFVAKVNALTAGSTVTIDSTLGNVFTLTPGQAETINATTVGVAGQMMYLIVTTSGIDSYILTFGTNFKTTGTLTTGTASGKVYTMQFISNGTNYCEVSRTTAM